MIFKQIDLNNFQISSHEKERWFLTKNKNIVKFYHVEEKNDGIYVYGAEVREKINFFDVPIYSSDINIFKTNFKEDSPRYWKVESISNKMFCMAKSAELINWIFNEDEDEECDLTIPSYRVFYPLIHTNEFI